MKINPGFPWQNLYSKKRKLFSASNWRFKEATNKCSNSNNALYGALTWTPKSRSEIPGKFLNVLLEMDCEDQLADRVGSEEVLQRVMEERNIQSTVQRRNAKWTGHILQRNCLLKHVIEGKIVLKICDGKMEKKT